METNFFCGNTLDRLSEKRTDFGFIRSILECPLTGFYAFDTSAPLAIENEIDKDFELCCLGPEEVVSCFNQDNTTPEDAFIFSDQNYVFLGENKQSENHFHSTSLQANSPIKKYLFAIDVARFKENIYELTLKKNVKAKFLTSRFELFELKKQDAAMSALSQSMLDWNRRYAFCATCGSTTKSDDAGYKRTCTKKDCKSNNGAHNTSFPRTDPVAISVVASKDNRNILLGRKKQFPKNMYSCLAGFMEPGESIEEAVRREVKEESGININDVQYISSQPWPYPSVLMIGCISRAVNENIIVCTEELEDAKWFTFEDVKSALKGAKKESNSLSMPPPQTIAHQLIRHWVNRVESKM